MEAQRVSPEKALLRALKSVGPYVILSDPDVLANDSIGRDVRLLVLDPRRAEQQLVAELGTPRFIARQSYVTGVYYDWWHVDLLRSIEWRGAKYLDATAVVQSPNVSPSSLARPRPAHDALISWLSSILWDGSFNAGDHHVIVDAASMDGDELRRVLNNAVGKRLGRRLWLCAAQGRPEDSEQWVRHLRRAVWWHAVSRAPMQTMVGSLRCYLADLRLHVKPPLPWIAVLGPDGSGKSTLVAALRGAWPSSLGSVHIHHLRPHRLNRRRGPSGPVVDPHGKPPRGTVMSTAALMFVVVDWWIGYWTHVARQRAKQGFVVFDRYLLDVSVDPRRYRYGGPLWLVRAACRFVPRPDVIVVLDASPTVVRTRKQEVSPGESRRQCVAYRRVAARTPRAHLIDASVPSDQVLEAVMTILRRQIHARFEQRESYAQSHEARGHSMRSATA